MIAWVRTHVGATVALVLTALVVAGLTVLYAGAEEAGRAAHAPDPPLPSFPPADFELAPALDTTNPLEDTPAVRAIRAAYADFAWAEIINSTDFAQYVISIDGNERAPFRYPIIDSRATNSEVPLGPYAFTPMAITKNGDGTTTVDACYVLGISEYSFDSHEIEPPYGDELIAHPQSRLLSPPTEAERANLANYDLPDDILFLRSSRATPGTVFDCTGVTVIQQEFTNWQENLWHGPSGAQHP